MAVFDVILFLIVVLFAALGVRRGLVLTVCGLLSIVVALGGAKVAADSLSPMVAEAITPRITATVEGRLEKNVSDSVKDAGETAKDSLSGILSIFGSSDTYEKASQQLQEAIQSGLQPSLETAARSVAKDLAQLLLGIAGIPAGQGQLTVEGLHALRLLGVIHQGGGTVGIGGV